MSTVLKFRRGNTTVANAFIGQEGELFVDTTKDTLVVHDGVTAGGVPLATESYVTTQISNLIDAAPTALNTLNELAAALNDDANFSSTVTTSLAGKQDALVSGTNIKSIVGVSLLGSGNIDIKWSDISNKPTLFSGSYNDLTDKPTLFDGAYSSLSGAPTFKTINGQSLLGSGDITITGGISSESDPVYAASSWYTTTNNSSNWDTSYGWGNHASAGYLTNSSLTGYATETYVGTQLSAKQNTLVSGTNIKTVNGLTLLGSGNINIAGGGSSLVYGQFADNQVDLTTTSADQIIDTYSASLYRSSKYIIQAVCSGVGLHTTEIVLLHDGTNVYITEYGTLFTDTSLFTVDANITAGDVNLTVTPVNANTSFDVVRTSLAARTYEAPSLQGDLMTLSGSEDLQTATGSVDLNA